MSIDPRSQKAIDTLRPRARAWFVALYQKLSEYAASHGLRVVITSGNRTWTEQDALFAQGRTKPGPRVTNARGGQSNHNYGIAVDVTLFKGETPVWESPHYAAMGKLGEALGLEWGGSWKSIRDEPHYQIRVGKSVAQLRALVGSLGWAGIDALIPAYDTAANLTTPPRTVQDLQLVEVWYDDPDDGKPATRFDIPAWFDGASTWVGGESFCDYFGGEFHLVDDGDGGAAEVVLNGEARSLGFQRVEGVPVVKFAQVNLLLGLLFSFDGKASPKRLTVHRDDDKEAKP